MSELYILEGVEEGRHEGLYYFEGFFYWYFDTAYDVLSRFSHQERAKLVFEVDRYAADQIRYLKSGLSPDELKALHRELHPGRRQAVSLQRAIANQVDIEEIVSVPGATWADCLAAALLGHCVVALFEENRLRKIEDFSQTEEANFYENVAEYIGHFAVDCMELLSVLATMPGCNSYVLPQQAMRASLAASRSISAAKAAQVKHKGAAQIKDRYIKWYMENEGAGVFHSKNQAAEKFHRSLSDDERRIVSSVNTLVRALRKHLSDQ